jgi:hypothetical protein
MVLEARDEAAPDVVLQGPEDRESALSEHWQAGPTVFIFLRHFG